MFERDQARIDDGLVKDKLATKTASATLNIRETLVEIDSTSAVIAIALAPVSEMAGKFVSLYVTTYVSAITVTAADSTDFSAPALNGAADGALFYSDGKRWWVLGART